MPLTMNDFANKRTYEKRLKEELKKVSSGQFQLFKNFKFGDGKKATLLLVDKQRIDPDLVKEIKKKGAAPDARGDLIKGGPGFQFLVTQGALTVEELGNYGFDSKAVSVSGGGDKGAVVNLDPGDKVIDPATGSVEKDRAYGADAPLRAQGQGYADADKKHTGEAMQDKKLKDADFSGVGSDAPIVLLAHGTPIGKIGSGKVRAKYFADKKPKEIITYLSKSLPKSYAGVVYLDGCYTAAGNSPMNYAKQVYDGLVKQGYRYLQVKGNLGLARTVDGKEIITPAELEKEYKVREKERKQLAEQEKKLQDGYVKEREALDKKVPNSIRYLDMKTASPEQKRVHDEWVARAEALKKREDEDDKLQKVRKAMKLIDDEFKAKYEIEALVGTFGPEELRK